MLLVHKTVQISIFSSHLSQKFDFTESCLLLTFFHSDFKESTMLEFLRKYQRYFFVVISIVIIISFSFFGTYSSLETEYPHEQVVFTAADGSKIKRQEVDELAIFLSTDMQDKLILGGIWGPNFLNDGVVRKDFLETGMGFILAMNYAEELLKDLKSRTEKERHYSLYSNPKAGFINAESAWAYFAPDMKYNYDLLKTAENPMNAEVLAARISLFLQEKQFSAPLLKQVLHYQEKQYSWIPPDPNLEYADLSLFGYHTLEDWFGPRFVRLVAQFIINSARIAEQKGYKVTKEEVLADLMQHAAVSFQQNINNPYLGVANLQQYFDEQLRRLNIDQSKAIKIWRDVLLFRRLFHDVGSAVVVDPFSIEKIQNYTKLGVIGQLFELPNSLRFDNYRSMQKLETYLNAVAKRGQDQKNLLMLPTNFLSVDEVSKKFPELIQHRYLLSVAQGNKNTLQTKVGVKETWNWEVEDQNWNLLKKKFPELNGKKDSTREERFAVLEKLNDKTRSPIDAFARAAIVDQHPEWIDQMLENAPVKTGETAIVEKGGKTPFVKASKEKEIIQLLDQASLKGEAPNEAAQKLQKYSPDDAVFYRITVLKRAPNREIITFTEAEDQGILDALLDKDLEAYYMKIRGANPSQYQNPDGSWKPLADVRDQIAGSYFEKIRNAVEKDYTEAIAPQKPPAVFLGDFLASLRLYAYMRHVRDSIAKDLNTAQKWVQMRSEHPMDELTQRSPLEDQWKLIKTPYQGTRSDLNSDLNAQEIFAMKEGMWSKVNAPGNGDLNFFHLEKRAENKESADKVTQIYQVMSMDTQRMYMQKLLSQLKEKKALSVEYMDKPEEN